MNVSSLSFIIHKLEGNMDKVKVLQENADAKA